jgi:hypothetical protein
MVHKRFTGAEDVALLEIIRAQKRTDWDKVVKELGARGFPKRTPKSVRNRHLRWKQAQSGTGPPPKNFCRKCGRPVRGHVCAAVVEEAPEPAEAGEKE